MFEEGLRGAEVKSFYSGDGEGGEDKRKTHMRQIQPSVSDKVLNILVFTITQKLIL